VTTFPANAKPESYTAAHRVIYFVTVRTKVGDNDCGEAMLFQNGEDVLDEIELFVARAGPKIVAMHYE
jgi:hypothetical protein